MPRYCFEGIRVPAPSLRTILPGRGSRRSTSGGRLLRGRAAAALCARPATSALPAPLAHALEAEAQLVLPPLKAHLAEAGAVGDVNVLRAIQRAGAAHTFETRGR